MAPTASAPGAEAAVHVGERDERSGNVELLVDVSGLPELDDDGNYALWLERNGEWAATCGDFAVGEETTSVRMTVSYDFRDFDAWMDSEADREELHPSSRQRSPTRNGSTEPRGPRRRRPRT